MCSRLKITYLSFAGDLLMFVKRDYSFVKLLHDKFIIFSEASGLQTIKLKMPYTLKGVADAVKTQIQHTLGYSYVALPFKYLGVPLYTEKLILL